MAALFTSRCTPLLRLSSISIIGKQLNRVPVISEKSASCVIYLLPPSSGYHTKSQRGQHIRLLQKHHCSSHFTLRPFQRNSSYFTSLLHKTFVLNAAEPIPDENIVDPASSFQSTENQSVLQSSEAFTNQSILESSEVTSQSVLEFSDGVTNQSILEVSDTIKNEPILETSSIVEEKSVLDTTYSVTGTPEALSGSAVETTSTIAQETTVESITYIPPPPAPPEAISAPLNALGEPTLQSVGLGGWSPVGFIQNCLDYLHVSFDIPWWGAIAIATVCIRILIFPLVITSQKNAAKMNNNLPQLQLLQMKMTDARKSGNQLESARLAQEMMLFMKEKDISPMKNVVVPLAQAPLFISMFMGLRRMANLPVESMKEGGLFWFTDLTLCDPYYILPIITATTMLATIELGTDGARLESTNMQNMKWVLRGLPILVLPFTISFPTAVLCYWVSTNFFSLAQVGILKIPAVRDFFDIPRLVKHSPDTLPRKKKGMVEGFKESWSNMKVTRELEDRERYDEMRFKKAGSGPVLRTFKHDPTKKKIINVQPKVKSKN